MIKLILIPVLPNVFTHIGKSNKDDSKNAKHLPYDCKRVGMPFKSPFGRLKPHSAVHFINCTADTTDNEKDGKTHPVPSGKWVYNTS